MIYIYIYIDFYQAYKGKKNLTKSANNMRYETNEGANAYFCDKLKKKLETEIFMIKNQ